MLYNAKNGSIKIGNTDMDYISFGRGSKNLVMLPGLGDGLRTVKGTAIVMAVMFRKYAKDYKVYVFSRKNQLEENCSIRDMAKDQKEAMDKLGISKASFIGISQGGMIAQYIAVDYPETVEKIILTVTLSKQNETMKKVLNHWIKLALSSDHRSLLTDTMEKAYTEKYLKRYRPFYPILASFTKPKNFTRFIVQAKAILNHNAYNELEKIKCPTLIIGAGQDKIVSKAASEEIAEKIAHSKLIIYDKLGHGAYEEAKDFNLQVLTFLQQ
jgi:Predicted hydrolases or acyltransferases (alpha/beta hydrolase superfamily)